MQKDKMQKLYGMAKDLVMNIESCMGGDDGTELVESESPTQEDDAEPGDYSGKGLMAKSTPKDGSTDQKKKMLVQMMRSKMKA